MTQALAVIPARWGSTRLPGKVLLQCAGKPLVQHVWERVRGATTLDTVVIATDDDRVEAAAREFGADVVRTRDDHPSGTDRVAEVATTRDEALVVNVQGDEPQIDPADLDRLVHALREHPDDEMATLARPLASNDEYESPHCVKVVGTTDGRALYFSRRAIPYGHDGPSPHEAVRVHKGVYGFRRDALLRLTSLAPSPLERLERLEQLRALEAGFTIRLVASSDAGIEVNTADDYTRFLAQLDATAGDPQ